MRGQTPLRFAHQTRSSSRFASSSRFEKWSAISIGKGRTIKNSSEKRIPWEDRIRDRLSRDSSASVRLPPGLPTGLSSAACGVWCVFFSSSSCSCFCCCALCALGNLSSLEFYIFRFFLSSHLSSETDGGVYSLSFSSSLYR